MTGQVHAGSKKPRRLLQGHMARDPIIKLLEKDHPNLILLQLPKYVLQYGDIFFLETSIIKGDKHRRRNEAAKTEIHRAIRCSGAKITLFRPTGSRHIPAEA